MKLYSSRQAAKELGVDAATLSRYISTGKIPEPNTTTAGGMTVYLWTEEEIETVRQLLPKIANGRKTRYKKKQLAISNSQLAKKKSKTKSNKKT